MRVAELVFHRAGRPVGDFRKAWAAACVEAGLYQVVGVNADGSEKRIPSPALSRPASQRRAQHGARGSPGTGGDGDLGPPDALDLRPLQHHVRGRSSRGDAAHERLRWHAGDAEHRDADPASRSGCRAVKSESRALRFGERPHPMRHNHAEEWRARRDLNPRPLD